MSAVERVMAMAIAVEFRIPSAWTRKGPVETSDQAETLGFWSFPPPLISSPWAKAAPWWVAPLLHPFHHCRSRHHHPNSRAGAPAAGAAGRPWRSSAGNDG